jgi:CBS domain containing-hemolysin-like protein
MFSGIQKEFSKNKLSFVILSALFIFVNSTAFADSDDSHHQQAIQLNKKCAPRVQRLIENDPVYAELFQILGPQVSQLKTLLSA